jgi:exopolyphosphatase / guanosine-5'-triphosphate,3'-diphosphate pyrophosphatase
MAKTKRAAVFDIGSNSLKLIAGEFTDNQHDPTILLERSKGTRLGEEAHETSHLKPQAIQRTMDGLMELKALAESLQISTWRAVATSAVRDAKNRKEFTERFKKEMGFHVEVLSGDEEASLIYHGVVSDPKIHGGKDQLLVMDSGGGSAEWIRGTSSKIEKRISLDLGCVRMTDRFLRGDPYTSESFNEMMQFYRKNLEHLKNDFSAKDRVMIGTGGSICTAAALEKTLTSFKHREIHGQNITLEELRTLTEKLRSLPYAERMKLQGIPPKRGDIIVAGVALFVVAMEALGASTITASLRGLRYGLLLDSLKSS